jgi:long-chain acyl-CoA synthetase
MSNDAAPRVGFWRWVEAEPERLALVDPDGTEVSFGELAASAHQTLHGLRALGLGVGDDFAVLLPNGSTFLNFYLAAIQGGFYITPLNFHLMPDEVAYVLDDSEAKLFVAHERFGEVARAAVAKAGIPLDSCFAVGDIEGFRPAAEITAGQPTTRPIDRVLGERLMYTSGTTGKPKGIRRPLVDVDVDEAVSGNRQATLFGMKVGEGVHLVSGPFYHAAPLSVAAGGLHIGNVLVLMDKWDAEETLRLIDRYKVTTSHMVPTMFHRLLSLPDDVKAKYDISSIESIVHGAAPVSRDVKARMIDWWGPVFYEYFGATEVSGKGVSSEDWLAHPGTVGKPWQGVDLKILDDDGNPCPPGVPGRIYMRSPQGLFEYHKSPVKTEQSRLGDFITVGDIGFVDEEGWLYPCDREANMIISGGVNIYPAEVEAVFLEHPAVGDVAVFGIPNDEWGEEVKAVVEPRAGYDASPALERDLIDFARSRIAHFKCPRSVDFRDNLPRADNGKLYKRLIKAEYWKDRDRLI